jgi:hypothetical protein
MSVSKQTGTLLENLPQRLVNFFARCMGILPSLVHSPFRWQGQGDGQLRSGFVEDTERSTLLENLPQRLVNFFARYPPQTHSAAVRRPAPANLCWSRGVHAMESSHAFSLLGHPWHPGLVCMGILPISAAQAIRQMGSPEIWAAPAGRSDEACHQIQCGNGLRTPLLVTRSARDGVQPCFFSPGAPLASRSGKRFGKWEAPRYGLRQQADLMKLAIKYNVEALLPPSRKSPPLLCDDPRDATPWCVPTYDPSPCGQHQFP